MLHPAHAFEFVRDCVGMQQFPASGRRGDVLNASSYQQVFKSNAPPPLLRLDHGMSIKERWMTVAQMNQSVDGRAVSGACVSLNEAEVFDV